MIQQVRLYTAAAPMAAVFDHTAHAHRRSESVLVEVRLAGTCGWGEGAPRPYVTGETLDSATEAITACDLATLADGIDWTTFETAIESIPDLQTFITGPSAAAAVEIALLDALCRHFARPLADVLPLLSDTPSTAAPTVSLVIPLSRNVTATLKALPDTARKALRHVKIKVAEPDEAVSRLAEARSLLGPAARISLDVNGGWSLGQAERIADELADAAWIEEPLQARSWPALAQLRRRTGLPIMLDESCTGPADLHAAAQVGAATHVNIRLSKCGGFRAAARLAAQARTLGIGCQLGVHVAEVGPLWAAARTLATGWGPWETVEAGRSDEWFPEPLTEPAFTVDRIQHRIAPLSGPGTGIRPTRELLRHTRCLAVWHPACGRQRP